MEADARRWRRALGDGGRRSATRLYEASPRSNLLDQAAGSSSRRSTPGTMPRLHTGDRSAANRRAARFAVNKRRVMAENANFQPPQSLWFSQRRAPKNVGRQRAGVQVNTRCVLNADAVRRQRSSTLVFSLNKEKKAAFFIWKIISPSDQQSERECRFY